MSFGRIIFNFDPLNEHYLNPPFFPNTRDMREKKLPFQMALKTFAQEQFMETFFWSTRRCTDSEKLKIFL